MKPTKTYNVMWLFVALVGLLALPPAIGVFMMKPAPAASVHAEINTAK